MSTDTTNPIASLGELIRVCVEEKGFQLPLYIALVAVNGSALFYRYVQGAEHLELQPLTQHMENGVVVLPFNIMLSDSTGQVAHALIEGPQAAARFVD